MTKTEKKDSYIDGSNCYEEKEEEGEEKEKGEVGKEEKEVEKKV